MTHHAIMPLTSWITLKYVPSVTVALTPTLNSLVHVIMYFYYYQTSIGSRWTWIKKYITTIQLVQFVIISIHGLHMLMISDSDCPKWFASFQLAHGLFFMYTFFDFYRNEYVQNKRYSQSTIDGLKSNCKIIN